MSEQLTLSAEVRTVVGKQVKQLRRQGKVPAVVYGQSDALAITVDKRETRRLLRQAGANDLITIQLASGDRTALMRDVQRHLTRGDVLHIDFLEVNMAETVTVEVDLVPVGQAAPEALGLGLVTFELRTLEIECLPKDLVSEIEVDLSLIKSADDAIFVRDLTLPPGVESLADPDAVVAVFEYVREEEEEEEEVVEVAPAADAVEVIRHKKAEEEEAL